MYLKEILKGVKFKSCGRPARVMITDVVDDSRSVSEGSLFIAKRGARRDGSKFINDAIRSGARAVVAECDFEAPERVTKVMVEDARAALSAISGNFYGHPSKRLKTVGVTGTNGKTTITYILEAIVKAAGEEPGVIGTVNYRMGSEVLPADNTTPGSLRLQSLLAQMVLRGVKYALMEFSSHALDQGRTEGVLLDAAIFTNLTGDHLDYHKTMAGYLSAKRKIFGHLKARGAAILNADDDVVRGLRRSVRGRVVTYALRRSADVTAADIEVSMRGTSFTVNSQKVRFRVSTGLIGMHNVSNALAAIAAAMALGIPVQAIIDGMAGSGSVPGRLEPVEAGQPFSVFVDFAHTEDALNNVLGLLRAVAERRIVTVFGCGGDRDRKKRPLMGRSACSLSDRVIITSDNPRSEDPEDIIGDIEAGIEGVYSNYDVVVDRRLAIARAIDIASEGDIVLLAGKGHETCQIIKDVAQPFDDRLVARGLLESKYGPAARDDNRKRKGARCALRIS
jgi:UDP-N-acetylmuramoyl-L-alanyl-D-glutamate--2,6-diaminopimelate ligase